MAIPATKIALQNAIQLNYEQLYKELQSIPIAFTALPELEGHAKGTFMSINNLLAYLIGWGTLVLKWYTKKENHESVDFPETGYKWNELGKLAQKFYNDYHEEDFTSLTNKLDQTVEAILALIEKKSQQELYEVTWYKKWTLGRMIQFNTSSPYSNAKARISKWKKTRDI